MKRQIARFVQRFPFVVQASQAVWRVFQPKFTAGAVGVVFNAEGQLLLVEHVLHPITPWGLPGGWVGRREHPSSTVMREFQEELALNIRAESLLLMDMPFRGHFDFAYLCTYEGEVGALSNELLSYAWTNLDSLPRLLTFHEDAVQQAIHMMKRSSNGE